VSAFFNERYSKLTDNGMIISLSFNRNVELKKSTINHELSHLIDHEKKISLKIKKIRDNIISSKISNLFNKKEFDNLCNMLYLSDDGEIKAITHQMHNMIDEVMLEMLKDGYDKNFIFEHVLVESGIKNLYEKMINYDINKDLENVSDKVKINFFNGFMNLNKKMVKIKRYPLIHKLLIIFYYLFSKENNISLDIIMRKTQKFINNKGIEFRNRIHRLYGLW